MNHLHCKKVKRQNLEKSYEMNTEERELEDLEGIFFYFYYRKRQEINDHWCLQHILLGIELR